jgi:hypothetical protein
MCINFHELSYCTSCSILRSVTLLFHDSGENPFDSVVQQRKYTFVKYYALAITRPSITHVLNPTACDISLKVLRYKLNNIINRILYIRIYTHNTATKQTYLELCTLVVSHRILRLQQQGSQPHNMTETETFV